MNSVDKGQDYDDDEDEPIVVNYSTKGQTPWHASVRKIFNGFFATVVILALIYFFIAICAGEWFPGHPFIKR